MLGEKSIVETITLGFLQGWNQRYEQILQMPSLFQESNIKSPDGVRDTVLS